MLLVCPLAALPRGDARRVDATPPIAVFHTEEGELFALDDTCTHQDASLADGWVEGCEVECPLHASRFDLRTGAVDAPPAKRPVRAHRVVVAGRQHLRRALHRGAEPAARHQRRHHHDRQHGRGRQVNTVAVVGASLAGLSAARALREQGFAGELVVVGEETHRPYDRPPLSKEFLAGRVTAADLVARDRRRAAGRPLAAGHAGHRPRRRHPAADPARTAPTSTPTASSSRPAPGRGRCPAPRASPASTPCAPSTTRSPCATSSCRGAGSW